ncbi:26S proteasome non-ATPase regulatory subunit 9-like [Branchiostoma lanceolatum]|uniref:26S proteasome non-ATPase regulatory subunit 9-like n=1 Tax=Branchiostoma lanceolatum TaxID=7740 RepID=UPI0034519E41
MAATVSADDVKKLMARKDEIEEEIKTWQEVLESQKGVGMSGPLVDTEDFPRSDIDVYQVRTARHNIICLQNDHKAIMREIEEGLHHLHAQAREKGQGEKMDVRPENTDKLEPFARVDNVAAGGPASTAGLQVGDLVLQFGSVTPGNFTGLQNIAQVVQHSEGKTVPVKVLRGENTMNLGLRPQRWSGRGLLGCNIVPVT